jgi:hypothetical protein
MSHSGKGWDWWLLALLVFTLLVPICMWVMLIYFITR